MIASLSAERLEEIRALAIDARTKGVRPIGEWIRLGTDLGGGTIRLLAEVERLQAENETLRGNQRSGRIIHRDATE